MNRQLDINGSVLDVKLPQIAYFILSFFLYDQRFFVVTTELKKSTLKASACTFLFFSLCVLYIDQFVSSLFCLWPSLYVVLMS